MNRYSGPAALLLTVLLVGPLAAGADPAPAPSPLAKQRRDAARKTYETVWANYRDGRVPGEMVYRWSRRWLRAEHEVSDKPADRIAACEAHLARMRRLEALVQRVQRSGQTTVDEVSGAEYYRVQAEIWVQEARNEKKTR
jgi:hypothetical protein